MKTDFRFNDADYSADLKSGISIARVPSILEGPFDHESLGVQRLPYRDGDFVGDVSQGGSCNVDVLKITPHCDATHTESLLHILDRTQWPADQIDIASIAGPFFAPAVLLTVEPVGGVDAMAAGETYLSEIGEGDLLVTAAALRDVLPQAFGKAFGKPFSKAAIGADEIGSAFALVIRTSVDRVWTFGGADAIPYFTSEAMALISGSACQHLLVDFPSLDRSDDGGRLSNHRHFWNVDAESDSLEAFRTDRTITEMVSVPSQLADGVYLLDLQIAPLPLDATLSRPVLFPTS